MSDTREALIARARAAAEQASNGAFITELADALAATSAEPVAVMVRYPNGRNFLTEWTANYQWLMQNERTDNFELIGLTRCALPDMSDYLDEFGQPQANWKPRAIANPLTREAATVPLGAETVARLKHLLSRLGLENAVPPEILSDPEALFSIFGQMRSKLDRLTTKRDSWPLPCGRPPAGWVCSRGKGHDGPCAASPADDSQVDAADPRGEYKGPNLTFDRLNRIRDFATKQSEEGATIVKINVETLLCLVDTIQHHEYVLQPAAQPVADDTGSQS